MLDYIDNEQDNMADQSGFNNFNSINQINENEVAMSEFLKRDTESRNSKGGWLSKENYYRKSSIGVKKMMTEDDLTKLTKAQLRKNKEQLMTDIICGIPETLQIDLKAQEVDSSCGRFKSFLRHTLCGNWLRDVYSAVVFLSMIINFIFFFWTSMMGPATVAAA